MIKPIRIKYFILLLFLSSNLFFVINDFPKSEIQINHRYKFTYQIDEMIDRIEKAREYACINQHKLAVQSSHLGCPAHNLGEEYLKTFQTNFSPTNAKEYILKKADSEKIIIMNHLDHLSFNHTFTESLLEELHAKGYKSFGVEGLKEERNTSNCGIPGFSMKRKNPHFANLLRKANNLGMDIFLIDQYYLKAKKNGVEKSLERVKRKIESGKILLYCSNGNTIETEMKGLKYGLGLAGEIKKEIGIDPLTIEQTSFKEEFDNSYEKYLYKNIKELPFPSVYVDSENRSFSNEKNPNWHDVTIFQPKTSFIHGRPNWLLGDHKELVKLDLDNVSFSTPYLVFALEANKSNTHNTNTIPIDIIEIRESAEEAYLVLPKGDFQIILQNNLNETKSFTIKV